MVVYLIWFILLFLITKKYKAPILNVVILFYIAASACSIYTHYIITPEAYSTFLSITFHLLVLTLFIYPVVVYGKNERFHKIIQMDEERFTTLSYVLIVLQAFSTLYFLYYDVELFASGDLGALRNAASFGEDVSYTGKGIDRTIAGVGAYYYCINILFFFYSLAFLHKSKWFNLLLIITSSSRIFHAFSYLGRDGILLWLFSFIFSFFLFKPYLGEKAKGQVKMVFVYVGGIAIFLLGAISLSRFGTDSSNGLMDTFNSLVDYFGQPLNNFGQLFDKFHEYSGTKTIFPWFYGGTGTTGNQAVTGAVDFYNRYGFFSNIFFSFVGNFYKAWGPWLTLSIAIVYSIIMSRCLSHKNITMVSMLILMFCVQIIWHNYFYFLYNNRVGNLYMVTLPLLMWYCSSKKSSKKKNKMII